MKQNYDVIETAKRSGGFGVFTGAVAEAGVEEGLKDKNEKDWGGAQMGVDLHR